MLATATVPAVRTRHPPRTIKQIALGLKLRRLMAKVDPFHSSGAAHLGRRAHGHYHIESKCQFGQLVKLRGYDSPGTGGYRLCKRCATLAAKRKTRPS
jgi:hypothetical protein